MFQIESLADALILLEVGGLSQYLAVIVNPAENDMTVRMRLVIMSYYYVRGIGQPHPPHIFLRHLGHKFVCHLRSIVWMKVE